MAASFGFIPCLVQCVWLVLLIHSLSYGLITGVRLEPSTTSGPVTLPEEFKKDNVTTKNMETPSIVDKIPASQGQNKVTGLLSGIIDPDKSMNEQSPGDPFTRSDLDVTLKSGESGSNKQSSGNEDVDRDRDQSTRQEDVSNDDGKGRNPLKRKHSEERRTNGKFLVMGEKKGLPALLNVTGGMEESDSAGAVNIDNRDSSAAAVVHAVSGGEVANNMDNSSGRLSDNRGSRYNGTNGVMGIQHPANESFNNKQGGRLSSLSLADLNNHHHYHQWLSRGGVEGEGGTGAASRNDSSRVFISNEQIEASQRAAVRGGSTAAADNNNDNKTMPERNSGETEELIRGELSNETWDLRDSTEKQQHTDSRATAVVLLLVGSNKTARLIKDGEQEGGGEVEPVKQSELKTNVTFHKGGSSGRESISRDAATTRKNLKKILSPTAPPATLEMPNDRENQSLHQQEYRESDPSLDKLSNKSNASNSNTKKGLYTAVTSHSEDRGDSTNHQDTAYLPFQLLNHTYQPLNLATDLKQLKPRSEVTSREPLGMGDTSTPGPHPHFSSLSQTTDLGLLPTSSSLYMTHLPGGQGQQVPLSSTPSPTIGSYTNYSPEYSNTTSSGGQWQSDKKISVDQAVVKLNASQKAEVVKSDFKKVNVTEVLINSDLERSSKSLNKPGVILNSTLYIDSSHSSTADAAVHNQTVTFNHNESTVNSNTIRYTNSIGKELVVSKQHLVNTSVSSDNNISGSSVNSGQLSSSSHRPSEYNTTAVLLVNTTAVVYSFNNSGSTLSPYHDRAITNTTSSSSPPPPQLRTTNNIPTTTTTGSPGPRFRYYTYKDKLEELLNGGQPPKRVKNDSTTVTVATPVSEDIQDGNYTDQNLEESSPLNEDDSATYGDFYYTEDKDSFLTGDLDNTYEEPYEYYTDEEYEDNSNTTVSTNEYDTDLQWLHHMEDIDEQLVNSEDADESQVSWSHGGRYPSLHHSFLEENSLSLMVLYTWLAVVILMLLISYVVFRHRQKISNFITDKKLFYRRRRSAPTEEGHQLLSANPYV